MLADFVLEGCGRDQGLPVGRMLRDLSDELWKLRPVAIDTGGVQKMDVPLSLVTVAL